MCKKSAEKKHRLGGWDALFVFIVSLIVGFVFGNDVGEKGSKSKMESYLTQDVSPAMLSTYRNATIECKIRINYRDGKFIILYPVKGSARLIGQTISANSASPTPNTLPKSP